MPTIYAIGGVITGRIKFGMTSSGGASIRLAKLQNSSPDVLTVIAEAGGRPRSDERLLHMYFARYRLHGEWFDHGARAELLELMQSRTFAVVLDELAGRFPD